MKMHSLERAIDSVLVSAYKDIRPEERNYGLDQIPGLAEGVSFFTPSNCPPFKSVDLIRLLHSENVDEATNVYDYILTVLKLIYSNVGVLVASL